MVNNPFFDVLGLPKSPDAAIELIEGAIRGATKVIESGVNDIGAATIETARTISGQGLDMNGSLRDFQEGKPKNPEEVAQKDQAELGRKRIFFRDLAEAQAHAQKVAHTPSLNDEDLEVQIEAMPEEVWNGKLHLSLDFAKKHTQGKPYYMTEYRRVQKEDVHRVEVATDQQTEAEIQAPVAFEMGENEMFKGAESKSHFTQVAG